MAVVVCNKNHWANWLIRRLWTYYERRNSQRRTDIKKQRLQLSNVSFKPLFIQNPYQLAFCLLEDLGKEVVTFSVFHYLHHLYEVHRLMSAIWNSYIWSRLSIVHLPLKRAKWL